MRDIALCTDTTCPSRDRCRRAITPAKDRQVYAAFQRNGQDRCGHYLEPRRRDDAGLGYPRQTVEYRLMREVAGRRS